MKRIVAGLSCLFLVACGTDAAPLAEAIRSHDSFTLAQVAEHPVEKAYVFCPYSSPELAEERGFKASDIPSEFGSSYSREFSSGIGLIYSDGTEAAIEWFDHTEIEACAAGYKEELDPNSLITVVEVQRKFTNPDAEKTVRVLKY